MTRYPDWQPRLVAYLTQVHAMPFAAGQHDCALFTAGAVKAMTGKDPARGWRSKYKTIRAGVRALKRAGHTDHIAFVASRFEEVAPAFAHEGDIAVVVGDGGTWALGIVQGEGVYVVTPERGLGIVSRQNIRRAFRV